ncbi:MAG: 50S ribosomal protein L37ae [Euryarchaeota archaeon]|nr:50S ribosomal protein L37ae [Euryarchaeota archaeon]
MSRRTNKVGNAGKWGSRYGVSNRRAAGAIERRAKATYVCPSCFYQRVRRQAVGIWQCRKCGHRFAGGAWQPFTRASEANARIIRRSTEGSSTADKALIARQLAIETQARIDEEVETDGDVEESAMDDMDSDDDGSAEIEEETPEGDGGASDDELE